MWRFMATKVVHANKMANPRNMFVVNKTAITKIQLVNYNLLLPKF